MIVFYVKRLVIAAVLLTVFSLIAVPALADAQLDKATMQFVVRGLERDPGWKCRMAMEHKQFDDAQDYCAQAVILDDAEAKKTPSSNFMYYVIRLNQAYEAQSMAVVIMRQLLQDPPTPEVARKNYDWALSYSDACATHAKQAFESPAVAKDVQSRLSGEKMAAACEKFSKTIRNLESRTAH